MAWNNQSLFHRTKVQNPCRDCLKRSAECHATCITYEKWKKGHIDELRGFYEEKARDKNLHKDEIYRTVGRRKKQQMKRENGMYKERKLK